MNIDGMLADATALHGAGRQQEAIPLYRAIIAARPDVVLAHYNLGLALKDNGDLAGAEAAFRSALRRKPAFAEAHNNLGNILLAGQRPERAEASFRAALRLQPQAPDLHVNLALALRARGDLASAGHSLRTALALRPNHLLAMRTLAEIYVAIGPWDEAERLLHRLLLADPDNPGPFTQLGNLLRQQERRGDAQALYEEAHRRWPDTIDFIRGLAHCLMVDRGFEAASPLVERALMLRPHEAQSHEDNARFQLMLDRPENALAACERALVLEPDRCSAHVSHGNIRLALGDATAARAAYQRALGLDTHSAMAHFCLGMLEMSEGNLTDGLRRYELRLLTSDKRDLGKPRWQGEPLEGRTLLLQGEQGFGDTIQFARYALLAARCARTLLVVQPALDRLMRTLPGNVEIFSGDTKVPPFDLRSPLLSLPYAFRTTLDTIPTPVPYLFADPAAIATWRERFAALPGTKVGLAWAGNPAYAGDAQRSVPLSLFEPLLVVPELSFVSLQVGVAERAQLADIGRGRILNVADQLLDFAETAAAMAALDLIVCVDSAVAHLAGALGRPVWLLNRMDTDWRWFRERDDSPWYPTMRIFRAPARDSWPAVMAQVAAAATALRGS